MSIIPNIIVLNEDEKMIRWLDPDLCKVEEKTSLNTCRKITLTYPYENNLVEETEKQWYEQGNKIYIPSINGITSCLYVINTEYEIDFWDKNTVTVEAEEVLTELNYDVISFPSASVFDVNNKNLDEWFGAYYDIGTIDTLNAGNKKVSPEGVMTRMSLLRMIEEQTERVFFTEYTNNGNTVKRTLNLKDTSKEVFIAPTDILDLNYNLDSLEFTKSEENTYNAIAPIFNVNKSTVSAEEMSNLESSDVSSLIVSKAGNNTHGNNANTKQIKEILEAIASLEGAGNTGTGSDTSTISTLTNQKTGDELLEEWLAYEVQTGEEIPMIIKEDKDGNLVKTATWNAPFTKRSGDLHMYYEGDSPSEYDRVHIYNHEKDNGKFKVCTSTTSETQMESVYNTLATKLLGKLAPKFELKIEVKDIQQLLGLQNLQYKVHQKLEVRVPNFNYYVPCRITETTKNLHLPGENKIKIETDVTSIYKQYTSKITSENVIISTKDIIPEIGGVLTGGDDTVLTNKNITISIRLVNGYDERTTEENKNVQQSYSKFDPTNETYLFSNSEIERLGKVMRNTKITSEGAVDNDYRVKDVQGKIYKVPLDWAIALYYARIQLYINNEQMSEGSPEEKLGQGYYDSTIECHWFPNVKDEIRTQANYEASKKYYVAWFVYLAELERNFWKQKELNVRTRLCSSEAQNGPTCLPASMSNATSYFRNYYPEWYLAKKMGTSDGGTYRGDAERVMEELGFKITRMDATEDNVKNYLKANQVISLSITPAHLGDDYYQNYYKKTSEGSHAIIISDWYTHSSVNDGALMVRVYDTNLPIYNPFYAYEPTKTLIPMQTEWMKWSSVKQAINSFYDSASSRWYNSTGERKSMTIIENTSKNMASVTEIEAKTVTTTYFDPSLMDYNFKFDIVRTAIQETIQSILDNDLNTNIMNMYTTVLATDGKEYEISMHYLRAISYAYMYSFMGTKDKSSNKTVTVSEKSNTLKYYEHFNTDLERVGVYDWFSPCNAENTNYMTGYAVATILFNLGLAYSPNDFLTGGDSLDSIATMIKNKAMKNNSSFLNTWIVSNTKGNIKQYLGKQYRDNYNYTLMFAYAKGNSLNNTSTHNSSYYPVLLYSVDGENIEYMNILGTGNNIKDNYNTLTNNANNSPYSTATIDNMVAMIKNASSIAPDGSSNQILVVSWYTKKQLEV